MNSLNHIAKPVKMKEGGFIVFCYFIPRWVNIFIISPRNKSMSWGYTSVNIFYKIDLLVLCEKTAGNIGVAEFRNFEYGDDSYYSIIKDCFDKENNRVHGLYVLEKGDELVPGAGVTKA